MPETPAPDPALNEPWLEVVRERLRAMRFGSVQIVVHEGRITQVESTEKTRFADQPSVTGSGKRRKP